MTQDLYIFKCGVNPSADAMATSFTVTGLYADRPAKRDELQACWFDLLVSLLQADYATELSGHSTLCVYAKEKFGQHVRKGKMHHLALNNLCHRSSGKLTR